MNYQMIVKMTNNKVTHSLAEYFYFNEKYIC